MFVISLQTRLNAVTATTTATLTTLTTLSVTDVASFFNDWSRLLDELFRLALASVMESESSHSAVELTVFFRLPVSSVVDVLSPDFRSVWSSVDAFPVAGFVVVVVVVVVPTSSEELPPSFFSVWSSTDELTVAGFRWSSFCVSDPKILVPTTGSIGSSETGSALFSVVVFGSEWCWSGTSELKQKWVIYKKNCRLFH